MKIKEKKNSEANTINYSCLRIGDTFLWQGIILIKTNDKSHDYSISIGLASGTLFYFLPEHQVEKVECKLTYTKV